MSGVTTLINSQSAVPVVASAAVPVVNPDNNQVNEEIQTEEASQSGTKLFPRNRPVKKNRKNMVMDEHTIKEIQKNQEV